MNERERIAESVQQEVVEFAENIEGNQQQLEAALLEVRGFRLGRAACNRIEENFAIVVCAAEKSLRRELSAKMSENADRKRNRGARSYS